MPSVFVRYLWCMILLQLQLLHSTYASTINYESSCRTSDGQLGSCLHFNACEKHRDIVFKSHRTYEEVSFLKQNQCEPTFAAIQYNKVDFYFCCSRDWIEGTVFQMRLLQFLEKRKQKNTYWPI